MTQSQSLRLLSSAKRPTVVAMVNGNNGKPEQRNMSVSMDSAVKDVNAPVAVEVESDDKKQTTAVGGGVEDVYGEDSATEDHFITPWSVSVASGYSLLRDPHHNKGLAFTEKERDAHYLRGLLPPVVVNHDLQVKKLMHNIRQYQVPLQRYQAMMDLQERNERLFYKLLIENVEELLPIVYTPTVGEACQKYGSIFKTPQANNYLYRGKILEILKNWPQKKIQVIVVTDGERILGLGDLGCQGMGIPVGKLSLYTALGGIRPSAMWWTNNEKIVDDEFFTMSKAKDGDLARIAEYAELMSEFMSAVKQNYGEKVLIQFEDFANHNAFDLLEKYSTTHLVFNDDIQVVHNSFSLGAGEAGTGIAELIALEISKQVRTHLLPRPPQRSMLTIRRDPKKVLADGQRRPTMLIGSSGAGQTFTKDVVEAMASFNEGRAIFASGSPFAPVEYNGKVYVSGQSNNAYIFPGFGLGLIISGAIRVHDDMLLAACKFTALFCLSKFDDMLLAASEALAEQVTQEHFDNGLIYPPFTNIRKISAHIAAKVAAKVYELGLASRLPQPENLVAYAESYIKKKPA
ncbi:NADP-dependent malic enzyme gene [Tanacetum coccineum]